MPVKYKKNSDRAKKRIADANTPGQASVLSNPIIRAILSSLGLDKPPGERDPFAETPFGQGLSDLGKGIAMGLAPGAYFASQQQTPVLTPSEAAAAAGTNTNFNQTANPRNRRNSGQGAPGAPAPGGEAGNYTNLGNSAPRQGSGQWFGTVNQWGQYVDPRLEYTDTKDDRFNYDPRFGWDDAKQAEWINTYGHYNGENAAGEPYRVPRRGDPFQVYAYWKKDKDWLAGGLRNRRQWTGNWPAPLPAPVQNAQDATNDQGQTQDAAPNGPLYLGPAVQWRV